MADLGEDEVWGIEADVTDAFYNFSIPQLTHYFAFNHPLDAGVWKSLGVEASVVYDPNLRQYVPVESHDILYYILVLKRFLWGGHGHYSFAMRQSSTSVSSILLGSMAFFKSVKLFLGSIQDLFGSLC